MRHVTAQEIREIDRVAIDEYGMPGVILMENAGRGAAQCALEMLGGKRLARPGGSRPAARAAIVCGAGNNGGDGFVVARHLHNHAVDVTVHLLTGRDKISGDAITNLRIIEEMELDIRQTGSLSLDFSRDDLIVDAMLGTGLSGLVREPFTTAIDIINASGKPVLAIDIPSGLDADTGEKLGHCIRATRTATFALPKVGFTRNFGLQVTGDVTVIDIGVPSEILE